MSSPSSYYHNEHCFRAQNHQDIYQQYIHKKSVTPEKQFDLQEGQYPEIAEQISLRGWKRLSKPRTKISKALMPRNKSEITMARAVLIHSIIKGHDLRVEELIADNIAVLAEGVQGRSMLCFPSTIYRLCKEAGVPMVEFKDIEKIQVAKPITAKVMTTIRGRIINQPQNQPMEEDEDDNDAENQFANHDQD
ncbi:hypothetical protein PIB30_087848 [Stylosanthes scabra]|uniref:Putative plant transposon protein domain-containing protein n=1 Tax=Stylosanthes scabra TaxID=79078 RepID=A0ABU6SVV1_9FABA|nr:hypothetical protein [Stylosanthes scabra]